MFSKAKFKSSWLLAPVKITLKKPCEMGGIEDKQTAKDARAPSRDKYQNGDFGLFHTENYTGKNLGLIPAKTIETQQKRHYPHQQQQQ
jgi:hypothetical protein